MVIEMDNLVLCSRVEKGQEPLFQNSEKRRCIKCKHKVWITQGTIESIKAGLYPDKRFICIVCFEESGAFV